MRQQAPFRPEDLEDLDRLFRRTGAVVTMGQVHRGVTDHFAIGLRHDVDNNIEPAVAMARWEYERGYRATYFILHTAPYWQDKPMLRESLAAISGCGHEIGIHNNALVEAHRTGRRASDILAEAIGELRGMGYSVTGTVAHGDPGCYDHHGNVRFVNDQIFTECVRPQYDNPVETYSLESFGLDYDANWLKRSAYMSDSGGRWQPEFQMVAEGFPFQGQLHMLVHPDWWDQAFS